MNELSTLLYKGNPVRTEVINDEPWFVAKDVCDILGFATPQSAYQRLDPDEKDVVVINDDAGRRNNMTVINEAGLYNLIFTSRVPQAQEFKRWVTHDVLPSLRKNGSYALTNQQPGNALAAARQLLEVAEDHETRLRAVEERQLELLDRPVFGEPPAGVVFPKHNPDFMTVQEYCRKIKLRIGRNKRNGIGQRISFYCRKAGIFIENRRHGNRYPVPVLAEFFKE